MVGSSPSARTIFDQSFVAASLSRHFLFFLFFLLSSFSSFFFLFFLLSLLSPPFSFLLFPCPRTRPTGPIPRESRSQSLSLDISAIRAILRTVSPASKRQRLALLFDTFVGISGLAPSKIFAFNRLQTASLVS